MKMLFVKHTLAWPRVSGHDVHAFHMMQACAARGHEVVLATAVAPAPEALARPRPRSTRGPADDRLPFERP